MYSVVIADGQDLVRLGLRSLLRTRDDIDLIRDVRFGYEARALIRELGPDLFILDVSLPDMDGIELVEQLGLEQRLPEILVVTAMNDARTVRRAFGAGARGYVLKGDPGDQLLEAIGSVLEHTPYLSRQLSASGPVTSLLQQTGDSGKTENDALTAREREILTLIVRGYSNRQMADHLSISIKTVESHRAAIMHKLSVQSMADLMRFAIRTGIIDP